MPSELFWTELSDEEAGAWTPEPGLLVHQMPNERYHALPGASKSKLAKIEDSPFQYANAPWEDNDEMGFGTLSHTLLLQPELFDEENVVLPEGMRRDKRTKAYQEFLAEAGERRVVRQADLDDAIPLVRAIEQHPTWRAYSEDETTTHLNEVSGWWEDPETGMLCKFRADRLSVPKAQDQPLLCWDLKTFGRVPTFANLQFYGEKYNHWPMGCAFYADGIATLFGRPCDVVLVVVQSKPPFEIAMPLYVIGGIDTDVYKYGKMKYRQLLRRLADCEAAGIFPPAMLGIQQMELSTWAMREMNES